MLGVMLGRGFAGRHILSRCLLLLVGQLPWRLLILDPAGTAELAAGLDHQLIGFHIAIDPAIGHDLQPLATDGAVHHTTHHYIAGRDITLEFATATDGHIGLRADIPLDPPVHVQIAA